MKYLCVPFALVLSALLLSSGAVRADMVDFSFKWSVMPTTITQGAGQIMISPAAPGTASAMLGGDPGTSSPTVPTLIPGGTITTTSTRTSPPDHFDTTYQAMVQLTDSRSGQSGSLTFNGSIFGDLTTTSSNLSSEFLGPVTQTLTLGNYLYTATIDPTLLALPTPGANAPSLFDAFVSVSSPTQQTPEPASLVLGAAGLVLLGWGGRRRWLRNRP